MDIVTLIGVAVTAIGALMLKLALSEAREWTPTFVRWLIDRAVNQISAQQRELYREEWYAHVNECPGVVAKLWHGFGCMKAAVSLSRNPESLNVIFTTKVARLEEEIAAAQSRAINLDDICQALRARLELLKESSRFGSNVETMEAANHLSGKMDWPQTYLRKLETLDTRKLVESYERSLKGLRKLNALFDDGDRMILDGIKLIESATPASRRPDPRSRFRPT